MRRRLSTPKASPLLLKRGGSAEKPPKKQQKDVVSSTPVKAEKTSWFKSLDRRAKSQPKEQVSPSSALSFSLSPLLTLSCCTAAGVSEWTQRDQLQLEAQQAQSQRCAGQEFALLW